MMKWDDLPNCMKNDAVFKHYLKLKSKRVSLIFKRLIDLCGSLLLIIMLSPVIIILSVMIKFDSKGPVFYRQQRITRYGKKFKIFKFRTMVVGADESGSLITEQNDSRITKIGEKIRKYRIDEIPQLFNIFVGDMSFVGARPEVEKYVLAYSDEMFSTLLLPAGLTSLASIYFKDEDRVIEHYKTNYDCIDQIYIQQILSKKMKYNIEYLGNFNCYEDIKICLRTLKDVF